MRAKLFHGTDTCQTLGYAIDGAYRVLRGSGHFQSVRGNGVKAFETAAIEDDGGTKTATNGALSDRILRNLLGRKWSGHLCLVLKPPSSGK